MDVTDVMYQDHKSLGLFLAIFFFSALEDASGETLTWFGLVSLLSGRLLWPLANSVIFDLDFFIPQDVAEGVNKCGLGWVLE